MKRQRQLTIGRKLLPLINAQRGHMAGMKDSKSVAALTPKPDPTLYSLDGGDLSQAGCLTLQQLSNLLLSIRDNALLDKNERLRLLEKVDDLIWKRSHDIWKRSHDNG